MRKTNNPSDSDHYKNNLMNTENTPSEYHQRQGHQF